MRPPILVCLISCLLWACSPQTEKKAAENTENTEKSRLEQEHQLFRAGYADSVNAGLIATDDFKGSARRLAEATFENGAMVAINYGSPGKRGRVIWNGLVSYDQVWVSGAHWATAVSFSAPVTIADKQIPAGMYGFFTIPGREEWVLILNKRYDQHLADDYQESEDLVRMSVRPEALEEEVQRLTYQIIGSENSGSLVLSWDTVRVEMPFIFP